MATDIIKKPQSTFYRIINLADQYAWLILLVSTPLFLFITPETSLILLLIPFLWIITFLSGNKPLPLPR